MYASQALIKQTLPLLLLLLSIYPSLSSAQSRNGELTGKLQDNASKEALSYATVAVYTAADTAMVTFRMSDEEGIFKVPGLPVSQDLRVIVTMMGYGVYRQEFRLTPQKPELDLGVVGMEQTSRQLKEVVILAETPPVLVRNDTLEFNAASFKTLPTSLVEDLLKKLPGVSVDAAGNITVNGRAVQKILVDGKEFFGSDPKIATRNLPADVIEKVQVMDDQDALRRDPDMPKMDIPQVINLTFKKGIKKGMFGKLYAGGGTDERYEGGGILNFFRDTTQLSVLGYSNNLNRPGFGLEDISRIGGFDRSGFNSMMVRRDGGFALNGISFGATGEGIQQSSGGGANFNTVTRSGLKLNLQYFFGGINADVNQLVNSEQFLQTDTLNTRRDRNQHRSNLSHRLGGKVEWKPDTLTDLSISPSVTLSNGSSSQLAYINTLRNVSELLNESTNEELVDEQSLGFSNTLSFQRLFRKKGRRFSLFSTLDNSSAGHDQYNEAENIFYQPTRTVTFLDQLRDTDNDAFNMYNTLYFTEPVSKDLSAFARLNVQYFRDDNVLRTYMANVETGLYDVPVAGLSNGLDRRGWRNLLTTGVNWKIKEVRISPGIQFTSLAIRNGFQKSPDINQSYFYVFPSLRIEWKQFEFNYNADMREPNATDLQPVLDNTNPLFIRYGNPRLRPAVSNNAGLSFRKYDTGKSVNYDASVFGSYSNNDITQARTVDENGVQEIRPVNTDGNWRLSGRGRVMKDYKCNDKNQFSVGADLFFSYTRSLILLNSIRSYGRFWSLNPELEARLNLDDKLELNQEFSLSYQRSAYESNTFDNLRFHTRTSRSEIVVRLPEKVVWEATFDYWYNSNAVPGLQKSFGRLSAGVTYLFLKNDRAQLKLSVYDLLNQNISAYRVMRENLIEDYQVEALNRYYMLTFTYNIRNFGGKVGGRETLFRF